MGGVCVDGCLGDGFEVIMFVLVLNFDIMPILINTFTYLGCKLPVG